jgi:hypothetical protein
MKNMGILTLCAFLSAFFAVKNSIVKNLKNHKIILIIEVGSPDYKPCNLLG